MVDRPDPFFMFYVSFWMPFSFIDKVPLQVTEVPVSSAANRFSFFRLLKHCLGPH